MVPRTPMRSLLPLVLLQLLAHRLPLVLRLLLALRSRLQHKLLNSHEFKSAANAADFFCAIYRSILELYPKSLFSSSMALVKFALS